MHDPLYLAVLNNKKSVVETLIAANAKIDNENIFQAKTPLQVACLNENPVIVKLLLEAKADFNKMNNQGKTALHYAAGGREGTIVPLLIAAGADVNKEGSSGSALALAIQSLSEPSIKSEIVQQLLDAKANPDCFIDRNQEETPLYYACDNSNEKAVKQLLEAKASVNFCSDPMRKPAIHAAASKASSDIIQLLLLADADVNSRDLHGYTPLEKAYRFNNSKVAKTLLAAGAKGKPKFDSDDLGNAKKRDEIIKNITYSFDYHGLSDSLMEDLSQFLDNQDSKNPDVIYCRSFIYESKWKFGNAADCYKQLLKLNHPQTYRRLAEKYEGHHDYKTASEFYEKAVELNDDQALPKFLDCLQKLSTSKEKFVTIQHLPQPNPARVHAGARVGLFSAFIKKFEPKKAKQAVESETKGDSKSAVEVFDLSVGYNKCHEFIERNPFVTLTSAHWILIAMDALGNPCLRDIPLGNPFGFFRKAQYAAQKALKAAKTPEELNEANITIAGIQSFYKNLSLNAYHLKNYLAREGEYLLIELVADYCRDESSKEQQNQLKSELTSVIFGSRS